MPNPMTKADWHHILEALEEAETEFEELINEQEWYVSDVMDRLASAKQIVESQLKEVE